jgi:hypothetical protein
LNEPNQYFLRFAHRVLHDPAGLLDAQAETAGRGVCITKDVPILRLDNASIKGKLLGMRQTLYSGDVLDFKEMNSRPIRQNFSTKEIKVCKTSSLL